MPALFIGHGSPMNALSDNDYTQSLNEIGKSLPRPKLILCISAHWVTNGTFITSTDNPKIIYDFYGFPDELYKVTYPAKGSAGSAIFIRQLLPELNIQYDNGDWGLDHGSWSVLKHLYPNADIPVLQLSLDAQASMAHHLKIAQSLSKLRDLGVLIVGSGNVVHNLRQFSWQEDIDSFDWARSFNDWFKERLLNKELDVLSFQYQNHPEGNRSVPTLEHYLPALYIAATARESDTNKILYDKIQNGSIAMTSFEVSGCDQNETN